MDAYASHKGVEVMKKGRVVSRLAVTIVAGLMGMRKKQK
jgi:hypothetical protein